VLYIVNEGSKVLLIILIFTSNICFILV
jgi:hypothetical protein